VQVLVRDNNVDQALKALKKKMQREGIFREMKLRNYFEKPSEKRVREQAEAVRRARKLARKKMQREGLLPSKPAVVRGAGGPGGARGPGGPGGARGPGAGGAGGGYGGGNSGGGFGGGGGGGFGGR
jgi:small subunit ribosomal protein S21